MTTGELGEPGGRTPCAGTHGGIHIGEAGAVAIGDHNQVTNHQGAPETRRAPDQEELLQAVRRLRDDLTRLVTTDETEELVRQLSETEDEIQTTGRASEGRLTGLRTAMQDAATALGLLASGAAVGQAVSALLGG
ncbi:hypothetical protein ACFT5D_05005 [Streptomyces sp. NPDC057144]|uniref:hypothetical protein n=1 Tax=Streptomyces TaxID=1883 RepID=UPI0028524D69|nr:hypothetical protein [Streptomyces salinarius]